MTGRTRSLYIALSILVGVVFLSWPVLSAAKKAKQRRQAQEPPPHTEPRLWTYSTVAEYPHDASAFTQGLQFDQACDNVSRICYDVFWESTGLNGRSSMRQVDLATGGVRLKRDLGGQFFGEGSTRLGGHLYMLTWKTGASFRFSLPDLSVVESFDSGLGDGWGLTTDGTHLIASESSDVIHWLDPTTRQEVRRVVVTDRGHPIRWLNELEVVEGELWGNVWQTECIARVNMTTGVVLGWIHLHGLREGIIKRGLASSNSMDVLNGIAYDSQSKRIFVTGKLWPKVFEIKVKPYDAGQVPVWASVKHLCWPHGAGF